MEKYQTAKSYQSMKWDGEPFEEKGKMYVNVYETCAKCGGKGYIQYYAAIDHGTCFDCKGAGVFRKKVRVYTQKELIQQEQAAIRKREKKMQELEKNSEHNRQEWMRANGFGTDDLTWCVFGDDTYAIKDWLKDQGCKFDPLLKWHTDHQLDLPAGYDMFKINFYDIFTWNPNTKGAYYKENAKEYLDRKFQEAEGPSLSQYVGEIGERLRNLTVIYKSARGFSSEYGWTNIYTFECGDNVLVWFTTKELDFKKGTVLDLTATVKKHEEFRGVKTTQLSRAILKEVK